jgi:hypothetical protein
VISWYTARRFTLEVRNGDARAVRNIHEGS